MLNYILNSRIRLVFLAPFFLGSLSVFSFQPFNLTIINFFIFPCFFFIISNISKRSKNTYRKKPFLINLFYAGYFFGVGFFLSGTHWISNSLTFDESFQRLIPLTVIAIPLFLGIFYGFGTLFFGKYIKFDFQSIFLFSGIVSLIDYLRSNMFTGFPWNLWSYSWSWFEEIFQILNPIGLYAFNLLSITLFCLPTILFMKNFRYKILTTFSILLLVFVNYLYGNIILNNNEIKTQINLEKKNFINLKIVSPNFDLKYNLSDDQVKERLRKLVKYSDPNKELKTLFIWPEGALSGKYFYEILKYKDLIKENFSKEHTIVLGTNILDKKTNKFYNSFVVVDRNLNILFRYDKIKLVPFGEFMPFLSFFDTLGIKKITEGLGSFSAGKIRKNFSYNNINIVPLICYEIIFPKLTQNIDQKKNIIINISEDAWFGNSIGPYQHFSKSVFRAVESDSFTIRSANRGISAIVNNKGQIIKTLKNNESGNIEYNLPLLEKEGGNKNDLIFFILLFTYWFAFLIFKKND